MKTAKFSGVIYEVKETGKRRGKPAKSYVDFNGYDTDRASTKRNQLGLYLNGKLEFTVGADGKTIFSGGQNYGTITIKESL